MILVDDEFLESDIVEEVADLVEIRDEHSERFRVLLLEPGCVLPVRLASAQESAETPELAIEIRGEVLVPDVDAR